MSPAPNPSRHPRAIPRAPPAVPRPVHPAPRRQARRQSRRAAAVPARPGDNAWRRVSGGSRSVSRLSRSSSTPATWSCEVQPRRPPSRWRERVDVLLSPITGIPAAGRGSQRPPSWQPAASRRLAQLEARTSSRSSTTTSATSDRRSEYGPTAELAQAGPRLPRARDARRRRSGPGDDRTTSARPPRQPGGLASVTGHRTLPAFDVIVTFTDRDREVVAAAAPSARTETIRLGNRHPGRADGRAPEAKTTRSRSSAATCIRRTSTLRCASSARSCPPCGTASRA